MSSSMASSEDTEITLGTGKLLVLFFVLVAICAGSFSLGYKLGSKSEPAVTSAAVSLTPSSVGTKPASSTTSALAASKPAEKTATPDSGSTTPDAKPVTPDSSNPANAGTAANSGANAAVNPSATPGSATNAPDPATTLPAASSYFVQVAAVSKQEDADALVDALKKKDYPAFVSANAASDKLFRIQVGPFSDIQDAEAMRTRLIGDGYNPIVKK
ncbi:MAG: SPOR domain-containing protein [Candidatus Sulfotelmatobacter sp.]